MRPVTIELEGFGAFRDRTVVDLSDAELFAIVGATGHGKSTLIDAVCFALYGSVPRHPEREVAPSITLGANEAKVSFTFDVGGERYIATRVVRRKPDGNGATTRALRLEHVQPDGTLDVLAGAKREFDADVERLVGLTFEQFTKCVVLPQGRFAEFLHARSGDRVAILHALLDLGRYDRMAARARERAKESAGRADAYERERARLGDVDATALQKAEAARAALVALQADIEAAAPEDARRAEAIAAAQAGAATAQRAVDALGAVTLPDDIRALTTDARAAQQAAADAAQAVETADAAVVAADARVTALPSPDVLRAALKAHDDRERLATRITNGIAEHEKNIAAVEQARERLIAANADAEAAEAAFEQAQQLQAHAELRGSLAVGEPCPVCEQTVAELPAAVSTTALTNARKARDAARKALKAAEADAQKANDVRTRTVTLLESLREQLQEVDARIGEFGERDAIEAQLADAHAATEAAAAARADAAARKADAKAAAQRVAAMDASLRKAEQTFAERRDALVGLGLQPPAPEGDLAARWNALAQWAAEARPEFEKRAAELADAVAAHTAEREAMLGDLLARAIEAGVSVQAANVGELAPAVAAAVRDAEHEVTRVTEQLARAKELDENIARERTDERVAADLGRLLDKRHFGQWLVDEALRGLVRGASEILERLSNRQYALTTAPDGEILVVDHANADETRSVRSLSGGETFQASLALALALADRISDLAADGAPALESIFLDEGFGTLDPETLDIVAGTIESLGGGERVVGIVTHVRELAERMPTRFLVRKEGRSAVVTREDS